MKYFERVTEEEVINFKKTIARNVKFYRNARNLTQEKLAELANISTTSVSNLENALYQPETENLLNIAKALNVNPYELYLPSRHLSEVGKTTELDKKLKELDEKERFVNEKLEKLAAYEDSLLKFFKKYKEVSKIK